MLSVRACRALPVSGRWAPHSTCVISLIPCNGPSHFPLADRGGHGIIKVPMRDCCLGGRMLSVLGRGRSEQFSPEILGTLLCIPFMAPIPENSSLSTAPPTIPLAPPCHCRPFFRTSLLLLASSLLTPALFSSPSAPRVVFLGARKVMTQPWDRSNPSPHWGHPLLWPG